ncbi:MAG: pectate lyase [Prevotellaceae bacterium]|nr:pectate lyase [Prevotellaceae bacterium]
MSLSAFSLAFPGAEGYGKYTVGGRGGHVFVVTNLNNDGQGSLREAVQAQGARIVVFAVSGNIFLESPLRIANDSITILGQTVPGDGICLCDCPLSVSASEVIVRYLRVRVGDKFRHDSDALGGGRYGQHNVVLDHLSVSWSIDECLSIYKTKDLTVQWCLVTHSLTNSLHTKGSHGFGGIWGGYRATFHHNLLANHSSRNPRFSSVDGTKWVDCRNNAIYNWGFKCGYGGGHHAEVNIVNNYYKPGPATRTHTFFSVAEDQTGRYYIDGNVMEGDDNITLDNRKGIADRKGLPYHPSLGNARATRGIFAEAIPTAGDSTATCLVAEPFPYEAIAAETARESFARIIEGVGCSLHRDAYDAVVVSDVVKGTATYGNKGLIDTPSDVGGLPRLRKGKPAKDTDHDGMPDKWERAHHLNPTDASDAAGYTLSQDYSNIEVYANSLLH